MTLAGLPFSRWRLLAFDKWSDKPTCLAFFVQILTPIHPEFTWYCGSLPLPGTVQRGRATTLLFLAQLVKIFPRLSHKITQNTNHLMSSGAWGRGIGEADEREVGSASKGRGAPRAGSLRP